MPAAEITPLVVDSLSDLRAADRSRAVVPRTPPSFVESASIDSSADGSSTTADAGAALSALMVQMSNGTTRTSALSLAGAGNLPNDSGSLGHLLPKAVQNALPNRPTPPPGAETISLYAASAVTAAPPNTSPATGAAGDLITSVTAAEESLERSARQSLSPQAGDVFIVDDSSTSADAGAALSAFLVQIRSSSSDAPSGSALGSSGEQNSDQGSDLRSLEAPTASHLPVRPGKLDIGLFATSSVSDPSPPDSSTDTATLKPNAATVLIGPAAEPTSSVDRAPVSATSEATAIATSRAAEAGLATLSLSLQMRARASEAALVSGSDVPSDLDDGDIGIDEAPRSSLPTGPEADVKGRPTDTSGLPDDRTARDDMSAPGESFSATRRPVGVAVSAVRASDLNRVTETATAASNSVAKVETEPALSALLSLRPASDSGAEPGRSGERHRPSPDASQAPNSPPTRGGAAAFHPPVRNADDAAMLGSDLLAAGLLPLATSLATTRLTKDGHHRTTSRVTPAAPVLASGSATSDHAGSGQGLLKHAQTVYAVEANAVEL